MRSAKTVLSYGLAFLLAAALISGCAKMKGTEHLNSPPTVHFVNTPKDAHQDSSTTSWVFNMPFTLYAYDPATQSHYSLYQQPDTLVKFPDIIAPDTVIHVRLVPGEPVVISLGDSIYYNEGVDYIIDYETSAFQAIRPQAGGSMKDTVWTATENLAAVDTIIIDGGDTLMFMVDTLIYYADFRVNTPNFYIFSYAPTVHWRGSDPDGFVEGYAFADITDPLAVDNPQAYIPSIPAAAWDSTLSTFATIFLTIDPENTDTLHMPDDTVVTTEHVVYLKCWDDDGAPSNVIYRTFFRSNQAPYSPVVKWDEHNDSKYGPTETYDPIYMDIRRDSISDVALEFDNTLYCLPNVTPNWFGIVLRWKGEDPDDKELYKIPLTFNYYLEKIEWIDPGDTSYTQLTVEDTIWRWSDTTFTTDQVVTITDLQTGSYRFTIWSFDDGFERSPNAASLFFDCVRPTFFDPNQALSILLYDETKNTFGNGELPDNKVIDSFYVDMLRFIEDSTDFNSKSYGYTVDDPYDTTSDQDVFYWDNSNASITQVIPIEVLSKYRMVIFYADDHKTTSVQNSYRALRDLLFHRYLMAGGRIWVIGRRLLNGSFGLFAGEQNTRLEFLNDMQVQTVSAYLWPPANPSAPKQEFIGGIKAVDFMNDIMVDTAKVNQLGIYLRIPPPGVPDGVLPEVDWMGRDEDATTLYYYNSVTAESSVVEKEVWGRNFVQTYPRKSYPTGREAWITLGDKNLIDVITVINFDKPNSVGEAEVVSPQDSSVRVSYDFMDTLVVNENSQILDQSIHRRYSDPTPTSCFIRTSRYQQDFIGGYIYNVAKSDTANTATTSLFVEDPYAVRVGTNLLWEVGDSLAVTYHSSIYWEPSDSLYIRYTYNPVSRAHLKPVAIRYEDYEIYNYTFPVLYYRSAVFTFPLYFMRNDSLPGEEDMGTLDQIFYEMLDWFLYPGVHTGE